MKKRSAMWGLVDTFLDLAVEWEKLAAQTKKLSDRMSAVDDLDWAIRCEKRAKEYDARMSE